MSLATVIVLMVYRKTIHTTAGLDPHDSARFAIRSAVGESQMECVSTWQVVLYK